MEKVFRCFVEKKPGFDDAAAALGRELREQLGLPALEKVRLFHRYDVEGLDVEQYAAARTTVLAEPQVDDVYDEALSELGGDVTLLAVEALPGQYDQRSDSAGQCIQLLTGGERPAVQCAEVYALFGMLTEEDVKKAEGYLINPVECRRAAMDKPETLRQTFPVPEEVKTLEGFTTLDKAGLEGLLQSYGLAMDLADLTFLQDYFRDEEKRQPTVTELRLVDTYWSDHCRHTTFSTHIDGVNIEDERVLKAYEDYLAARVEVYGEEKAAKRPQTLMDIATIGTKTLKKRGLLQNLDESEEINACSIHVDATVDGQKQDWLLMFKNETHNHPTEIEPFGGAATCVGGAIRDPLSGRSYVYQAMRVTGCGDPRTPLKDTLPGKLPQRKLCQTAAAGYSSYGNQIGLATGIVREVYHPGYVAKHMEVGAVVGAAPASAVVRMRPEPGDVVLLLGGRTGRDGIGGATGSSKTHNLESLTTMASEVQKGNAPEERKIQRLFRNEQVTRLIKRCNDFGAGGVSVAIGELADGLAIDLDKVRKKYDGLDGTELAISESQERMAVVVAAGDVDAFIRYADAENLEAYPVAEVTESPRLTMTWRGQTIADLSRAFLNTNGASKHTEVRVSAPLQAEEEEHGHDCGDGSCEEPPMAERLKTLVQDLNICSQRGLVERFDNSVGAASVLMPFGGKEQLTPTQTMAALLPVAPGKETTTCSVMANGFDPYLSAGDPFAGAYSAVVHSVAQLAAAGCDPKRAYLSLQEYFEKLREESERWGKPFSALLGALKAQLALGVAAIGGKDSMSGSFLDLDVPPTLISFAIAPAEIGDVLSPEFKEAGHPVRLFLPEEGKDGSVSWDAFHKLCKAGKVHAAWAVGAGGAAEGLVKMSFGNRIGFAAEDTVTANALLLPMYGAIVAECAADVTEGDLIGYTQVDFRFTWGKERVELDELLRLWEAPLEEVYPTRADAGNSMLTEFACKERPPYVAKHKIARPKVVIPAFPGTNSEYDSAAACLRAGLDPEIFVVRNLTGQALQESIDGMRKAIEQSQVIMIPGGFSGGDEPDGSAKFICSFFRNQALTDAVHDLLRNRDGLMLGICNGFQALVKLGLIDKGEIVPAGAGSPTLTFNRIGRHQSRYVTTVVSSVRSPWMLCSEVGDRYTIPISHGEGRFVAPRQVLDRLIAGGQVATRYADGTGAPTMDISGNPNGSLEAIEGVFSPDGRVFGKMGHTERCTERLVKNISGNKHQPIFESCAKYYA